MRAILLREPDQSKQSLGIFIVLDGSEIKHQCKTVELKWNDNKVAASCIPAGTYIVKKRQTAKFGNHFHIQNVPGRTGILIHIANFSRQLKGCIAPGLSHRDIDSDGLKDVVSSTTALEQLYSILPDSFKLTVV